MYNCNSTFRVSSFGYMQCNSAYYFHFTSYVWIMGSYSKFCKKVFLERVLHFGRESKVDSNLHSLLRFGTSLAPSAGVAHFQGCLCIS